MKQEEYVTELVNKQILAIGLELAYQNTYNYGNKEGRK
jgi:hypothetical protein